MGMKAIAYLPLAWAVLVSAFFAFSRLSSPLYFFPQGLAPFNARDFVAGWAGTVAAAGAVVLWVLLIRGWGALYAGWLSRRIRRSPFAAHFECGAGFGLLGLAVLGLGLTGLLFRPLIALACLLPFGGWRVVAEQLRRGSSASARSAGLAIPRLPSFRRPDGEEPAWVRRAWQVALALPVLVALPLMTAPEGSWDAMVYHLRFPSFFLMEHRHFAVTDSPFVGYPALMELHYLLALAFTGSDRVTKLLHAACWLMTARLLFVAASRAGRTAGRGTALAWLLAPLGMHLAGIAYVDLATAWLASLAALAAVETTASEDKSSGLPGAVFAGVLAGFAFLTKLTGGLVLAGVLAVLFRRPSGPRGRRALGATLGLACGGALVAAVAWPVRNWLVLGNPLYPFLPRLLGGLDLPIRGYWPGIEAAGPVSRLWAALIYDEGGVGAVLGPLWAIFLVAALLSGGPSRAWRFFAVLLAGWLLLPLDSRFLLPAVPAALLASVPAWDGRRARAALIAGLVLSGPLALRDAARASFVQYSTLYQFLGLRPRETYLRLGLSPEPEYRDASLAANSELSPKARLFFVAGLKSWYFERRCAVPHQHIDPIPLLRMLREAGSAGRLAARLRQGGFTHLVYMPRAALAYPCPGAAEMTDAEAAEYVRWFAGGTTYLFRTGEALFYSLGRNPRPRSPGRVPLLEDGALKALSDPAGEWAAKRAMAQLSRLAPASSSVAMLKGSALLVGADRSASRALPLLERAVRDPEVSSVAWRACGYSLFLMGEEDRALACFRQAVTLNPSDAEAHFNAGQVFVRRKWWDKAAEAFALAYRSDPSNPAYRRACYEAAAAAGAADSAIGSPARGQ